jgi:hypothetical protein
MVAFFILFSDGAHRLLSAYYAIIITFAHPDFLICVDHDVKG